jgi:uncharacterized Fe-S cluster-containing radical SAM superfamily protein
VSDDNLEDLADTLKEIRFPSRFAVEVNADCNLNCSMCHHDQMIRPKGRMPFPLWQKCADEVAQFAPKTQVWFSFCGEPLLAPELLLKMLAYGNKVGLQSLNINTNGVLLNNDVADKLLDSGIERIVIGIDGFSKEAYILARCGGDRDLVYGNVEYLLKRAKTMDSPPEINVQFIEMECNKGELETFKSYWLERGATVKARNMLSWGGRFDTPLKEYDKDRIPCPWAMTMMHVFWDGRVPRCPGDTEGVEGAGNVWDESVVSLWKKLGVYRKLHMAHDFNALPERCLDCTDWKVGIAERIRIQDDGSETVSPI